MSMLATDFKSLFTINIKKRCDGFTDQYNRIFMVKIFLACTIITGLSWYNDDFNCVLPNEQDSGGLGKFVSQTCWIQGVYVYQQLRNNFEDTSYYGLPKDLNHDGMVKGHLCSTSDKFHGENEICEKMKPTYYLQYQWMPFYLCALALIYYLPYMFHKNINYDMVCLRNDVKDKDTDAATIFKHYFGYAKKHAYARNGRIFSNILIKVGYVVINIMALCMTDNMLEGKFISYGREWFSWMSVPNALKYDYRGNRDFPKPGNDLLPPFGFCEVYSAASDKKRSFGDKHKLLCEVSQFILYQYAFILLWFCIVVGIIVSLVGVVLLIIHYAYRIGLKHRNMKSLLFRQREYLEYIRVKDTILYGEIMVKIKEASPYINHNNTMMQPLYNHDNKKSLDVPDSKYSPLPATG